MARSSHGSAPGASKIVLHALFATPVVRAYDVRCTAHRSGCGDEEGTSVPTLVFPRRGVFRWHVGNRSIVADPNTALLLHPARPFRIGHPGDGGDDCTSLRIDYDVVEHALGARAETPRLWTLPDRLQRTLRASLRRLDDAVDGLDGEETTMAILELLAAAPPRTSARDEPAVEAVRERIAVDPSESRHAWSARTRRRRLAVPPRAPVPPADRFVYPRVSNAAPVTDRARSPTRRRRCDRATRARSGLREPRAFHDRIPPNVRLQSARSATNKPRYCALRAERWRLSFLASAVTLKGDLAYDRNEAVPD